MLLLLQLLSFVFGYCNSPGISYEQAVRVKTQVAKLSKQKHISQASQLQGHASDIRKTAYVPTLSYFTRFTREKKFIFFFFFNFFFFYIFLLLCMLRKSAFVLKAFADTRKSPRLFRPDSKFCLFLTQLSMLCSLPFQMFFLSFSHSSFYLTSVLNIYIH